MTIETPLWMQDAEYPARLDRAFIEYAFRGTERVMSGLAVTQDGAGNFNVVVGAGVAIVAGTDTSAQGFYLQRVTAAVTVAVPASPVATRTDSVILRIRDGQAGGGDAPTNADAVLEVIEGTTIPESSIRLATIARTSGEGAILTAAITDTRPLGPYPYGVGTSSPPSVGVPGDLYVQVAP